MKSNFPSRRPGASRTSARSREALLAGLLAGLSAAACTGLPRALSSPPSSEREVPRPEDHAPPRWSFSCELEAYELPNGLAVVLLEDHALPKVVVGTWFAVGSKDERPGQTGFAHLFEHLVLMGPGCVDGEPFQVLLERGGGSSHASTSSDSTHGFSMGPSDLLPTLLAIGAERLAALDVPLSEGALERERSAVRAERRDHVANVPYGVVDRVLPGLLYPPEHPYHHALIGSPADLEGASAQDVAAFFREHYVPANATLVVAGDFEAARARPLIERTFGALVGRPAPVRPPAPPAVLAGEIQRVEEDRVEFPKLVLAWHSPPAYARGDAELELLATILAEGPDSRLDRRLVLDLRLAQEVDASQQSAELGSVFTIEVLAAPGADLERVEQETLAVLEELAREGPSAKELERAAARAEARFLRRMEGLLARAEMLQAYRRHFGVPDGFVRDLERRTRVSGEAVRATVRAVFGLGRVDLRILPASDGARPAHAPGEHLGELPRRTPAPLSATP